jgi:hypothetical protein
MGQSAGSFSATYHLVSPASRHFKTTSCILSHYWYSPFYLLYIDLSPDIFFPFLLYKVFFYQYCGAGAGTVKNRIISFAGTEAGAASKCKIFEFCTIYRPLVSSQSRTIRHSPSQSRNWRGIENWTGSVTLFYFLIFSGFTNNSYYSSLAFLFNYFLQFKCTSLPYSFIKCNENLWKEFTMLFSIQIQRCGTKPE